MNDALIDLYRGVQGRRVCVGYSGYTVDRHGNVFSHRKKVGLGRGNGKGTRVIIDYFSNGKKLTPRMGRGGYPVVGLVGKGGHQCYVHRLVAEAFVPNPYNKPQVNHKDSNPLNSSADNLEWVTQLENNQHALKKGRRGGKHCNFTKLTEDEVREIRELASAGTHRQAIASAYGITAGYVSDLKMRRSWKYI